MNATPEPAAARAGAAMVDITPALGTHLSGDLARLRPALKVLDPLYARALVVEGPEAGGTPTRLCFLSLDLLSIEASKTARIRREIEARTGIPAAHILVHTIQNHSAPGLGHWLLRPGSPYVPAGAWWMYGCDADYEAQTIARIVDAAVRAAANLGPFELGAGGRADGRIAFNRRFVLRDGSVQTQPRPTDLGDVLCPEGPADPEVGLACLRKPDGPLLAALLHHTAHPVSHFNEDAVSASWPGAWCRRLGELAGSECVPLSVNGCCGNVNVFNALDPKLRCDDEHVADMLTETTREVMAGLKYERPTVVRALRRELQIPYGRIPAAMVRDAKRRLRTRPGPEYTDAAKRVFDVDWLFCCVIMDLSEKLAGGGSYPYEIQAFRIGDLALVGLIGEPFVQGQLQIKQRSPARRTFVAHMCNGYVGYIPTRAGHRARNFNYRLPDGRLVRRGANLFQLHAGALDTIVRMTKDMLGALFDD